MQNKIAYTFGGLPRATFCVPLSLCVVAGLMFWPCTNEARADRRSCAGFEQRYAQTKLSAGSVERNILLFSAAGKNCLPLAKLLLDDGASLEARDRLGNMPLAIAARSGHESIANLFLDHKAPINARNLEGSTALFLAAEAERTAIAKILVERGADPNLEGRTAISPLGAAAYSGNPELVTLLLAHGAQPNRVDATGKTPIIYAAGRGYTPVVRHLLDAGVDVNLAYGNNLTALIWAAGHSDEAGSTDVLETLSLLIAKGAHLDAVDDRGRTALMTSCELGHTSAVAALLKAGAKTGITDKTGKRATDLAANDEIRNLLEQH